MLPTPSWLKFKKWRSGGHLERREEESERQSVGDGAAAGDAPPRAECVRAAGTADERAARAGPGSQARHEWSARKQRPTRRLNFVPRALSGLLERALSPAASGQHRAHQEAVLAGPRCSKTASSGGKPARPGGRGAAEAEAIGKKQSNEEQQEAKWQDGQQTSGKRQAAKAAAAQEAAQEADEQVARTEEARSVASQRVSHRSRGQRLSAAGVWPSGERERERERQSVAATWREGRPPPCSSGGNSCTLGSSFISIVRATWPAEQPANWLAGPPASLWRQISPPKNNAPRPLEGQLPARKLPPRVWGPAG